MFAVLMFRGDHIALLHEDLVVLAYKEFIKEELLIKEREEAEEMEKLQQSKLMAVDSDESTRESTTSNDENGDDGSIDKEVKSPKQ